MLGELLHGGQMMVLYPKDFASVTSSRKTSRAQVERIILQPSPSGYVQMEMRISVYHAARRARLAHDVSEEMTNARLGDEAELRSGRIVVGFYPFTSRKPRTMNVVATLTDEARGELNVWLDSLLESGKLRS